MQVFANGKQHCHSFIEFYLIQLKNQEIKISSEWHFKIPGMRLRPHQENVSQRQHNSLKYQNMKCSERLKEKKCREILYYPFSLIPSFGLISEIYKMTCS